MNRNKYSWAASVLRSPVHFSDESRFCIAGQTVALGMGSIVSGNNLHVLACRKLTAV